MNSSLVIIKYQYLYEGDIKTWFITKLSRIYYNVYILLPYFVMHDTMR